MPERRIVITGLGAICALGRNKDEFWDSLARGVCGIRPLETVDRTQFRVQNGAEVLGYDPAEHFPGKEREQLDRFAQFAVTAGREAVADSGIEWRDEQRERAAIVTGSCVGGQATENEGYENLYVLKNPRVNPLTIPRSMENAGASRLSLEFGITGPVYTVSTACSSSNHAIGQAFWLLRQGVCDMALAGGSEAPFGTGVLKAWEAMRVLAPDTCRPFSKDRRGLVLGEGGAMLVMETLEAARARGARIYAEILGFGMSSDAHHLTQPAAEGAARAMRSALSDGGVDSSQVGYINAHGTGTLANDPTEVAAIRSVFNSHAGDLAVSSTKSMHGHALGAAGAIEAVATILALDRGLLPPTANFTERDPQCDIDVIPNTAREQKVDYALSNSFAFGGLNAVLALGRFRG
ncbi:MAG: beta-ketoacyl-[acyl-carrier-protein] synthase family protein [Bryobacteraceae bacterium]|nr:beta-ketoacyl-[acyl-carrier-protein] synthase family protein [Bryobacterales bacterium]MEB2360584.1 beta-ketoacyl-[acyl-carrier-protein] synthase family protein [Bryobacterales bacterium]NUN02583.1 beta-ketoacyl-[acyl-carrier-protein] synthase family protein [Bryobacteraceae bacterium]